MSSLKPPAPSWTAESWMSTQRIRCHSEYQQVLSAYLAALCMHEGSNDVHCGLCSAYHWHAKATGNNSQSNAPHSLGIVEFLHDPLG